MTDQITKQSRNSRRFSQEGLYSFVKKQTDDVTCSFAKSLERQKSLIKKLENVQYLASSGFSDLVNFSKSRNAPIHRWFKYREGYSPELVFSFVNNNDKKILDPFCGSGTTLICAKQRGLDSVGIDINPMSVFISRTKSSNYSSGDFEKLKKLSDAIPMADKEFSPSSPPKLKILSKVFHPEILDYLLRVKAAISTLVEGKQRDFLFLGWLSVLESVSNTRKEGNGIKYRSTRRTKDGYIHIPDDLWQRKYFGADKVGFARTRLHSQYQMMLDDVEEFGLNKSSCTTDTYQHDSTNLDELICDDEISTAIFSPPYANCFDYFEIFKVELWMGDFVNDYERLGELRKRSLGSLWRGQSHTTDELGIEEFTEQVSLIKEKGLWDNNVLSMLQGYFSDLREVLLRIHAALVPGGKCVIVVGNSAYSNVLIPTDLILARIGNKVGFERPKIIIARYLTTSSQQKKNLEQLKQYLRESIIVLDKPPRA